MAHNRRCFRILTSAASTVFAIWTSLALSPREAGAATPSGAVTTADFTEAPRDGAPLSDPRASYSFLRTVEGNATVASTGNGLGEPVEINQPLLTGDQVRVASRSRLELALADRNRLYLDAETTVLLERVAFSGDRDERTTVLRLEEGELLLVVSDEALGDELPRVITANATLYVQEPGEYRVEAGTSRDGQAWTRLTTRRGYAEIVTDRGSSVVREGEAMTAAGDRWTRLELAAADDLDGIEQWRTALEDRAQTASRSARYVEPQLAYDAAPLDQAGDWIEFESVRYWRPYVSSGWRPYWQGRWSWTPSGYTWVSYEPWGWVPYHYGRWCSLPGYGWVWRPGAVYSPAWVYWNWTSSWAGWVPMGYYTHFYDPWYRNGFRYGVYGWASGGWGLYSDWNFAPVHCFRDRRFRGQLRTGRDLEHESRLPEPPRGLVTTDSRDFRPDRIDRTEDLLHQIGRRHRVDVGQDLPDVTDFVGRKGRLPADVARNLVPDERYGGKGQVDVRDRGLIRDIDRVPKVAETPSWRAHQPEKPEALDRTPRVGGGPREVTPSDRGRSHEVPPSSGLPTTDSGKREIPRSTREARPSDRSPVTSQPQGEPKIYGPSGAAHSDGSRQQWKDRESGSEPVQKVVGSVRRPTPEAKDRNETGGTRDSGPKSLDPYVPRTYGESKDSSGEPYGRSASPSSPSMPSGKRWESPAQAPQGEARDSGSAKPSGWEGKRTSTPQTPPIDDRRSSPPPAPKNYQDRSPTPSPSHNFGRAPANGSAPQAPQIYGKGSPDAPAARSTGDRNSSSGGNRDPGARDRSSSSSQSGKAPSSSGSRGSAKSAPPPDPKQSDDGHHAPTNRS